jgi:hypothetical protein
MGELSPKERAMARRREQMGVPLAPPEYVPPPPLEGDDLAQAIEALEAVREAEGR